MSYEPFAYWSNLLKRDDLSRTGHPYDRIVLNDWLYRNGRRNLDRFLARHNVGVPPRAFDAGAGTGFWVDYWHDRGTKVVDGCDFVPEAVERLRGRFRGRFVVHDLSLGAPTCERFPFVSAMNVLLHITTDAGFATALAGVAEIVEPGGMLLLAEPAVRDRARAAPFSPSVHARIRHISDYVPPGLTLVAVAPTAVIGADPIEGSCFWRLVWRVLTRISRINDASAALVGRAIYLFDPVLLRLGFGPSGKFLLFRREDLKAR